MTSHRAIGIDHKNSLSGYVSNWRLMMNQVLKVQPPIGIPQELVSLGDNTYDLSLMLSYLDDNLTILEETPLTAGTQINYQAYASARSFLKVCYLLLRILLDDVSGILKYFYDREEPRVGLPKSFADLLKKADSGKLPPGLTGLLASPGEWFPEMRKRRVGLEHRYESLLVSFDKTEDGKTVVGHFSTREHTASEYGDVRAYFGFVLCGYQTLVDNLLDHFDAKFTEWYGFKPHRDSTIMLGIVDLPLWWAYRYGNYRHQDLHVTEGSR